LFFAGLVFYLVSGKSTLSKTEKSRSKRFVMNQADISQLVSKLRIRISPRHKNLKNPEGPQGRLKKLCKTVNALFKYERLELNYTLADETRGYAERVNAIITSFIYLFTCRLSKNGSVNSFFKHPYMFFLEKRENVKNIHHRV